MRHVFSSGGLLKAHSIGAAAALLLGACTPLRSLDERGPDIDGGGPDAAPDAMTDAGPEPGVIVCPDELPAPPAGARCTTTPGTDALRVSGTVLTPDEILINGEVLVGSDGRIACVACDCGDAPEAAGATGISCPDGVISPGLINAHHHMTFQVFPLRWGDERFEHRHDWRLGDRGHTQLMVGGTASEREREWAEVRMVQAGVTSVNSSGASPGLARNLDRAEERLGLEGEPVIYDTFPLGDLGGQYLESGCGYPNIRTTADIATAAAYTPHLAEGIGVAARNELLCVLSGANDLLEPQTAIIQGIALRTDDIQTLASEGVTLIWSPRSNIALYGMTAAVTTFDRLGVPIALGTDWQFTGSSNLLRELSCADGYNRDYLAGYFDDRALWRMATANGALATATETQIGAIQVGLLGDLSVFDGSARSRHRAVVEAGPEDVMLVMRGGRVLYGDRSIVDPIANGCDVLEVCGVEKALCLEREIGRTFEQLRTEIPAAYPTFSCGVPPDEPSCIPARTSPASGASTYDGVPSDSDLDGDGVEGEADNCPTVFNPVRPIDLGAQPDRDADGLGDDCDECPYERGPAPCE